MTESGMLFPGQGAQKRGMGKDFYDNFETARKIYKKADNILSDCKVSALCFEADEEEIMKTENTQPALFTTCFAIFKVLEEKGYPGNVFAGHSLGEYTAIAAGGFFSFEDGLTLVRKRGLLMKDCDPERKGGMAAVIGLSGDKIERICREVGDVYPANYNSPIQIVISGKKEKVEKAVERLKLEGAKRCVILNVGGAFHSPYMKEAASEMEKALNAVQWETGKGKIISNANAQLTDNPEEIKSNLVKQLYSPVVWSDSMQKLVGEGYKSFIEPGPGGVLKGLFKSIDKEVNVLSVEKVEHLDKLENFTL